jgi:hypothetical protein
MADTASLECVAGIKGDQVIACVTQDTVVFVYRFRPLFVSGQFIGRGQTTRRPLRFTGQTDSRQVFPRDLGWPSKGKARSKCQQDAAAAASHHMSSPGMSRFAAL